MASSHNNDSIPEFEYIANREQWTLFNVSLMLCGACVAISAFIGIAINVNSARSESKMLLGGGHCLVYYALTSILISLWHAVSMLSNSFIIEVGNASICICVQLKVSIFLELN